MRAPSREIHRGDVHSRQAPAKQAGRCEKTGGGIYRYKVTKGGPRGRANTKTRRGASARAEYLSSSAAEDKGIGATLHLHFTRQLASVGTLTSPARHFGATAPGGTATGVARNVQLSARASSVTGDAQSGRPRCTFRRGPCHHDPPPGIEYGPPQVNPRCVGASPENRTDGEGVGVGVGTGTMKERR